MTYTQHGDEIVLQMTVEDYQRLLLMLGVAAASAVNSPTFRVWIEFVNELNRTNPAFTPYEIPALS